MTSKERHQLRFQRRKAKRELKSLQRSQKYTNINDVFGFIPMINSYKKCKQNVTWKASTQTFMQDLCAQVKKQSNKLLQGTWKSDGFYEFDIIEKLFFVRNYNFLNNIKKFSIF